MPDWYTSGSCFADPITDVGQSQIRVINSTAEYNAPVHCGVLPVIDFSAYTLLAGKTKAAGGCIIIHSQQVTQPFAGYKYTVRLALDNTGFKPCPAVSETVYYANTKNTGQRKSRT